MKRASWLLPLALALAPLAARGEQRFALVIGANAGWSNDRPLRHAESDAERLREVLVELGGFPADRAELLRDPDSAEVRSRLRRLSATVRGLGEDALVLVYYSGHADATHLHLKGLPLGYEELLGALRELPAKVRLGVIDACRSGSIVAAKGGAPIAPFAVAVDESVRGLAVLTSSGADELSQETRALAGSVFTHHLVSGLRGAADADRSGQVTLAEAYRYAYGRTEADTAGTAAPQRPAFRYELKGQGEVVLTRPTQGLSALVLPKGEELRYVVVDPLEWRLFAEGHSSPTEDVVLALEPGRYQVKRVQRQQLEVASLSLAPGQRLLASQLAYAGRPLSTGLLKGRPDASDAQEAREFRRREALKLLADGETGAALSVFDELLAGHPDDRATQRGRARALVRMAEAYERVGNHPRERQALDDALLADPALSEDPDFNGWYRRLAELEKKEQREVEIEQATREELERNPRLRRRWGFGLDIISPRGMFLFVGNIRLHPMWFLNLGIDPVGPGVDVGFRFVPLGFKFSPFLGAGGHLSLESLGLTGRPNASVGLDNQQLNYNDVYGRMLHLDVGVQYMGSLGFSSELGLGAMLFQDPRNQKLALWWLPQFNFGWYF